MRLPADRSRPPDARIPADRPASRWRLPLWLGAIGSLALLASACSPLRVLGAVTPDGGSRREAGLPYAAGERQRLDVHRPAGPPPAAGWPMVVFFYGGSWRSGERADYAFVGRTLAAAGVLTVVADYRLYPEVRWPDFLHDGAAAVARAWQQAPAWGGDRQRLFLMGHSAGAYNAAMLALDARWLAPHGLQPSQLAGWIGLSGPYDFVPIRNTDVQPVFHHPQVPPDSQPVAWVSRGAPPALLVAGLDDDLVDPQRNSAGLAARLQAAGVPVHLELVPGRGHVATLLALAPLLSGLAPVRQPVLDFVARPTSGGR